MPTTETTDTTLPTTETTASTTTTTEAPAVTSPPATVAPAERVQTDTPGDRAQRRLQLVIWALLALAGLALASTVVFWRLTRPVPDDEAPAMRWAPPGEPAAVEGEEVLVGAAAADAAGATGPVTEPHPVVTVPPGPPMEPVVAGAVVGAAAGAAAEVVVPAEVLDPAAEFQADDATVPPRASSPVSGPPPAPAEGMWASAGWGQTEVAEPPAGPVDPPVAAPADVGDDTVPQ